MTRFERWYIKRIFKREVVQGFDHDKRIQNLYQMIRDAAADEFTEDNESTRDSYLLEWFNMTQKYLIGLETVKERK